MNSLGTSNKANSLREAIADERVVLGHLVDDGTEAGDAADDDDLPRRHDQHHEMSFEF
jgi:hypothetical protein